MSCIDAAIIKALVEHIGMDPDDVGSSHGDTKLNVSFGTVEQSGMTYITITENDTNQPIRPGDMLIVKSKHDPDFLCYYYCIQRIYPNSIRFIDSLAAQNYTLDGSTITTNINAESYEPIGVYRGNSLELLSNAIRNLTGFIATSHA